MLSGQCCALYHDPLHLPMGTSYFTNKHLGFFCQFDGCLSAACAHKDHAMSDFAEKPQNSDRRNAAGRMAGRYLLACTNCISGPVRAARVFPHGAWRQAGPVCHNTGHEPDMFSLRPAGAAGVDFPIQDRDTQHAAAAPAARRWRKPFSTAAWAIITATAPPRPARPTRCPMSCWRGCGCTTPRPCKPALSATGAVTCARRR